MLPGGENEDITFFSIKDNGIKCKICGKTDKSCIQISKSTLNAIKYVVTSPPKKLYSFDLKDEALEEFKLLTKVYFDEKLDKKYRLEDIF